MKVIIKLLGLLIMLMPFLAWGQDAAFFACEEQAKLSCDTYGTIEGFNQFIYINGQLVPAPNYPNPPEGQTSGNVTYYNQCIVQRPQDPPGTFYQYGWPYIASCTYSLDPKNFNLSVAADGFTANPSAGVSNNLLTVYADTPTRIFVKITGEGFNTPEDRTVQVMLNIPGLDSYIQTVDLSNLVANGYYLVPFDVILPSWMDTPFITFIISPYGKIGETTTADNSASIQLNVISGQPQKPSISISSLRVAQRVFEPSASDGATTDLVTKKPYAVEMTLSATVPAQYKDLTATASLYVNGLFYNSSAPFKIGDIVSGSSKAFVFGEEVAAGNKTIEVRILPSQPVVGVFEDSDGPIAIRNTVFHDTKLSLLVAEITGCDPKITSCFAPPTFAQRSFFESKQIPFAEAVLPLSTGGISISNSQAWNLSTPGVGTDHSSIYKDAMHLWLLKKVSLKNVGVYIVGDDYFIKHGEEKPSEGPVLGLVLPEMPSIAFVKPKNITTLTHELIHTFNINLDHSTELQVQGVGANSQEVWTSGQSLDRNIVLGNLAQNLFGEIAPTSFGPINIDRTSFNQSLNSLIANKVDPKVVLVTGVIDPQNKLIYYESQRAETFLDDRQSTTSTSLKIEGLNNRGQVVSSVSVNPNHSIELIRENGSHVISETDNSLFAATLPDDRSMTSFRVIKNSQTILTLPVDKVSLKDVISGLTTNCFALKPPLSSVALNQILNEYGKYETFKKKNPKVARESLVKVRSDILRDAANTLVLSNDLKLNKATVIELIDSELL